MSIQTDLHDPASVDLYWLPLEPATPTRASDAVAGSSRHSWRATTIASARPVPLRAGSAARRRSLRDRMTPVWATTPPDEAVVCEGAVGLCLGWAVRVSSATRYTAGATESSLTARRPWPAHSAPVPIGGVPCGLLELAERPLRHLGARRAAYRRDVELQLPDRLAAGPERP